MSVVHFCGNGDIQGEGGYEHKYDYENDWRGLK